jgi:hypothetical protein
MAMVARIDGRTFIDISDLRLWLMSELMPIDGNLNPQKLAEILDKELKRLEEKCR